MPTERVRNVPEPKTLLLLLLLRASSRPRRSSCSPHVASLALVAAAASTSSGAHSQPTLQRTQSETPHPTHWRTATQSPQKDWSCTRGRPPPSSRRFRRQRKADSSLVRQKERISIGSSVDCSWWWMLQKRCVRNDRSSALDLTTIAGVSNSRIVEAGQDSLYLKSRRPSRKAACNGRSARAPDRRVRRWRNRHTRRGYSQSRSPSGCAGSRVGTG